MSKAWDDLLSYFKSGCTEAAHGLKAFPDSMPIVEPRLTPNNPELSQQALPDHGPGVVDRFMQQIQEMPKQTNELEQELSK